jgi:hypothetical protein
MGHQLGRGVVSKSVSENQGEVYIEIKEFIKRRLSYTNDHCQGSSYDQVRL